MKVFLKNIFVALLICALASIAVVTTAKDKVKAKTTAQLQSRSDKAKNTAVRTLDKGGVAELIGFSFGGSKQDLVVGAGSGGVSGNN